MIGMTLIRTVMIIHCGSSSLNWRYKDTLTDNIIDYETDTYLGQQQPEIQH